MFRTHPRMARRWASETTGKLPYRVNPKASKTRAKHKSLSKKYKAVGSDPGALIRAARSYRRTVKQKGKYFGETDTDKKTMMVNKGLSKTKTVNGGKPKPGHAGVLDTIVHEAMHAAHPKAHEKTVYKKTPKLLKKLTPKQKTSLYALFKK